MSLTNSIKNFVPLAGVIAANPQLLKVSPPALRFLNDYMGKFQIQRAGQNLILHSHLPPLNSRAYTRFVNEHLLARTPGPSHAQIGITNACPQRCEYCYNRNRKGRAMDKETILKTARQLKEMGVVWLGLTGGEPLLSRDILEIVRSVSDDCAVKLFTTGCGLSRELAVELHQAGVFSVCVSLDHWQADHHDRGRNYPGAFKQALEAIEVFKNVPGLHVGVSAVLSAEMIRRNQVEEFLTFLRGLEVQEAWLSEIKPSLQAFGNADEVIREEERVQLVRLQDRWNRQGKMTVNYLGHFEGRECFGCNAGRKMVYVDAFGEVSPCVFTPLTFGNVQEDSLPGMVERMRRRFPSEESCFMNKNYALLQRYAAGRKMLDKNETGRVLDEVRFGNLSAFNRIHQGKAAVKAKPLDQVLNSQGETA